MYYTHFDDSVTPIEETLSAYDEIIKVGKVRHIAISSISPERLIKSFEVAEQNGFPKYVALSYYNLVERTNYETEYLQLVEKYACPFSLLVFNIGFLDRKIP